MTYQDFFRLKDTPFRLTPDVDYFFPSESHAAALETLLYSIRSGEAFAQITGQPGVGKTILVRHLLNQLEGEIRTALILHPRLDGEELLKVILEDLGAPQEQIQGRTKEGLLRFFREGLLEGAQAGRTTVVIIDEAQEIPNDTLEELRLLSNLETEKKKLLSIILVGQTELEEKLSNPALRQLHQRITIRYRIDPFSRSETQAYVTHRLSIAGAAGNVYFPERVIHAIHRRSGGIPRQINVLCERALMAACVEGVRSINKRHLKRAIESYLGTAPGYSRRRLGLGLAAAALLLSVLGGGWWAFSSGYRLTAPADGRGSQASKDSAPREEPPADAMAGSASSAGTGISGPPASPSPGASTPTETVGGQKSAALPIGVLTDNGICLVVNRTKEQGQVWRGDGASMSLVASFEMHGAVLDEGVYLLGRDKDNRPFLFNHHQFEAWQRHQELAERLWGQFGGNSALPLIPLVVWSGNEMDRHSESADGTVQVRALVKEWAAAWRSLNIDAYMQFYGPTHFNYFSMRNEPTLLSREQYYSQISKLFQNNSFIALQISEPVCIVNPADPQSAVAIFSQRYASPRYVDEGIKVLFLRQLKESEGAEFVWKIEGRCWMPMPVEAERGNVS